MAIEAKMVMGMVTTATPATLSGSIRHTTMMTDTMAMSISSMKSCMEWSTTWLWSLITLMCTSLGNVCW